MPLSPSSDGLQRAIRWLFNFICLFFLKNGHYLQVGDKQGVDFIFIWLREGILRGALMPTQFANLSSKERQMLWLIEESNSVAL